MAFEALQERGRNPIFPFEEIASFFVYRESIMCEKKCYDAIINFIVFVEGLKFMSSILIYNSDGVRTYTCEM